MRAHETRAGLALSSVPRAAPTSRCVARITHASAARRLRVACASDRKYRHPLPFLPLIALVATLLAFPVAAQRAGDIVLEAGWLHSMPHESNGPPRNALRANPLFPLLGVESRFASEGVRLDADSIDSLALVGQYFLTDVWALRLILGYPPKGSVEGSGTVRTTGPLGLAAQIDLGEPRFNPTGRARQWVPVFLVTRHFGAPEAVLRPYLGIGVTYAFFTEVSLNGDLKAEANRRFGTPLAFAAGIPGPTTIDARLEPNLAPALAAGVRWRFSDHWSLSGGLTFIALETDAEVNLYASDGTELARSRTRLRFDPLNITLLAGYRF